MWEVVSSYTKQHFGLIDPLILHFDKCNVKQVHTNWSNLRPSFFSLFKPEQDIMI